MRKLLIILAYLIFTFQSIDSFAQQGWVHRNMGTANLVSVNFINSITGYVFRSDKHLFKTTSGGLMWDSSLINAQGLAVRQGVFINENDGMFMPVPGITTNGGASWNQGSIPSGWFYIQSMYLLNDSIGFVTGVDLNTFEPCICKTLNAGINWVEVDRGGGANNFSNIIFLSDSIGLEARFAIKKTSDGGNNWFYFSSTSRQRVKFSKAFGDTIYLSSVNGYVGKTVNAGLNWSETFTGINQTLTGIYFINNQLGYAVGDTGGIVKTTNGGYNWIIQNSGTTRKLNEIWFINKDSGFIAGDSGLLLVTYNGGVTSLTQNYEHIPDKYSLHQNYPNPFNPTTKIKFAIPRRSDVRLRVFDQLGREVRTLVNGELTAGRYEYEFDGSGLASGVYFYRLEAGEYVETRRMVILK